VGHEFASCCLNQFASADPFIGLEVKQVSEHIKEYGPVSQGPQASLTAGLG